MSRGLGRLQRAVLDYLRSSPFEPSRAGIRQGTPVWVVTEHVLGHRLRRQPRRAEARATEQQRRDVRRALYALERRGLVERSKWARPGETHLWSAVDLEDR